ncbi:uncharacterized protein METZ01_LOCUS91990 [marine metagenome]|uniref:Uncharacterized protein n=1 Tax=marine metagenome TaxID=408172 RepID=A0A381VFJ9_9ZZZZ|tara:strand:+ start:1393 stop:1512 length:120 start_codon:yes stop_codon:yes gene_type:complete
MAYYMYVSLKETILGLASVSKEGSPAAEKGSTDDPISQP